MNVSVIIVNYKSKKYLLSCLQSLDSKLISNRKPEVIVVNNESKPLEREVFKNINLPVKIINSGQNSGFASACNQGARKARKEILFFLNPDAKILDNSLAKAVDFFQKTSDLGVLGAQIIQAETGLPQPWTSGKKTSLPKILLKNTFFKPWNKKTATETDWVSGTALLTPRKLFLKLNGFDERFFMYFEDQDYCLKVKKAGKRVLFYPHFSVIHYNGKSWKKEADQKKRYFQSQIKFFQKHMPFQSKILSILQKIFLKH
ncbi:MAG: glycosyltransferase family 2 protein [Patescibacteria group bacterium]